VLSGEGFQRTIGVDLSRDGDLDLAVYDLQGRLIRELAGGGRISAGFHRFKWDGRDTFGRQAASGVYLVRGRSGTATARTRVVQVR
jgi:flagellar hook assembly protein FlgD